MFMQNKKQLECTVPYTKIKAWLKQSYFSFVGATELLFVVNTYDHIIITHNSQYLSSSMGQLVFTVLYTYWQCPNSKAIRVGVVMIPELKWKTEAQRG